MQTLSLLSDLLLIGATLGLAAWCRQLSMRLRAFDAAPRADATDLAGRLSELAAQIAPLEAVIAAASTDTIDRAGRVEAANRLADDRIGRMEMLLASLEDLEEENADRLLQVGGPPTVDPVERMPSFRASRLESGGRG